MGWGLVLNVTALFWLAIHALHRRRGHGGEPADILPTSTANRRKSTRRHWKYELRYVYLRVETAMLNDWHDRLTQTLARGRYKLWRRMVVAFYDFGILAAALGQLAAFLLLVYTAILPIWMWLYYGNSSKTSVHSTPALHKRDFVPEAQTELAAQDSPIHLILPGVTVPFWHLPIIVLSLFICQVVHEAGHAITAALESVQLHSVGASLIALLPAAHVALPSTAIDRLTPRSRLRIIAAGALHNLVAWITLWLLASLGLGSFLWSCIGYQDVGTYGRVVVALDEHSALRGYLPVGAIITAVDDVSLITSDTSVDVWSKYLSAPHSASTRTFGWCTKEPAVLTQGKDCCSAPGHPPEVACFVADDVNADSVSHRERCAYTLNILRPGVADTKRCDSPTDCAEGDLCMKLRDDEEITRIEFRPRKAAAEQDVDAPTKVVIWTGPKAELLADVETNTYLPRLSFLPINLLVWLNAIFRYISTLSLSLFLFNVLPLPYLDGAQFLDALADALRARNDASLVNLEAGDNGRVSQSAWQRRYLRLKKGLQIGIGCLMLLSLLSGLFSPTRNVTHLSG